MQPGLYDIRIRQGASFNLPIIYTDNEEPPAPIDLTGFSARMTIRKNAASPSIIELTTENGRITLGGAAGTITLSINATDTEALPAVDGVYDLEVYRPGNPPYVDPVLEGNASVAREITR